VDLRFGNLRKLEYLGWVGRGFRILKSDAPKYSVFLDNRLLVSDVSRKERVALAKNKIPPN